MSKIFFEGGSQRMMINSFSVEEIELAQRFLREFVRAYGLEDNLNSVDVSSTLSIQGELDWLIACKKGDEHRKREEAKRLEEEEKKDKTPPGVYDLLNDTLILSDKWYRRGKIKRH